jgi:hypothetical protein
MTVAKTVRNGIIYGILLIAGVTFGMQMADSGSQTTFGPGLNGGLYYADQQTGTYVPVSVPLNVTVPTNTPQQPILPTPSTAPTSPTSSIPPATQSERMQTPADLLAPAPPQRSVDVLADKTAQLLQKLSKQSIHWVASLLDPPAQ